MDRRLRKPLIMLQLLFIKLQSPQNVLFFKHYRINCKTCIIYGDTTDAEQILLGVMKTIHWLKTLLLLYAQCCSNQASLKFDEYEYLRQRGSGQSKKKQTSNV